MECPIESGTRGVLAGRQPGLDLLEREGVGAEQRSRCLQIRERRIAGLVVPLDRRPLAEAGERSVPQLDLNDVVLVARLARDHERLGELQGDDPGGQLHAATLTLRSCNGSLHHATKGEG